MSNALYESLVETAPVRPQWIEFPPSWIGHVPFVSWLIPTLQPQLVVELGTHSGNSYFAMCQAVKEHQLPTQCVAVDTWQGDEHASFYDESIYAQVSQRNAREYGEFSTLLKMTFDQALAEVADGSVDLLHIDGMHTYEAVRHDFMTWLPKMRKTGVVLLHDTQVDERGFGVWKFWQELAADYPVHIEFTHSHGLGVVQLHESAHGPLTPLANQPQARTRFVNYFEALGQAVTDRWDLAQQRTVLEQRNAEITRLNGHLSVLSGEVEQFHEQIHGVHQQLEAVLTSKAWRATAPIRMTMTGVRSALNHASHLRQSLKSRGGLMALARKLIGLYRQNGVEGLRDGFRRVGWILFRSPGYMARNDYPAWIAAHAGANEAEVQKRLSAQAPDDNKPLISVIMPVFNPQLAWLEAAIASVQAQVYPHWELCIADDCSSDPAVRPFLEAQAQADARIHVAYRQINGHISAASNSAIALASGAYITLLDQDDLLTTDALFWVVETLKAHPSAKLIYSDEDKIDDSGNRFSPYFKSDWNKYLFYSHNLITHLGVYDKSVIDQIGGFRVGVEGAQDYDLALRFIEQIDEADIIHIPRTLYHWRAHWESTASSMDAKDYAVEAGRLAISEHFQRTGVDAQVLPVQSGYRAKYALPTPAPRVSIVILTRNGLEYLRCCIESIFEHTDYPDWEVVIVDNGSDDPACLDYLASINAKHSQVTVIRDDSVFNFSALNNLGVEQASGEVIALLNNDVEVIEADWLRELTAIACQPDVGAVGPKLLYPNGTVQHAGVVLGLGGAAGHVHQLRTPDDPGYIGRAGLINEFSALTGACLVVEKALYWAVGGLDSEQFAVAFNDVDFCLKLKAQGYHNVFTPHTLLYHHESVSRGYEDTSDKKARFAVEKQRLINKWPDYLAHDPCYNPNLSVDFGDFSLAWPPRHQDKVVS